MLYRGLGNAGERISALGLGGHHIGRPETDEEAIRLIRAAIDAGITFMDNCWDYHDGLSERRMGAALQDGYRERVFLMTKIDGRTYDAAAEQIEESLTRLRTDTIDLLQVHETIRLEDADRVFAERGSMQAITEARDDGRIRYIGFTGHKDPIIHLRMLEVAAQHGFRFDAVQMPLNVMDAHFRSFEHEVVPRLVAEGIGVLGMKSMADGEILKSGAVSAEECLRYALSLPTSCVITGIDSMEVLEQDLRVVDSFEPLTPDERAELLARTAEAASSGRYERFKTTNGFDGTALSPEWLGAPDSGPGSADDLEDD